MGRLRYAACCLLVLCPLALSRHDDDFAFDTSDEFQVELTANHSEIAKNGLKRLWGVPDTSAYVGHLFRMEIPKEAFSGEVIAYKVRSEDGRRTPSWLAVDSKHGLISGVPLQQDLGAHTLTVTAHGRTHGLTASDSFTIEVRKAEEKIQSKYGSCIGVEDRLVLVILVDGSFYRISPRQRIRALMDLSNFMALDGDEFWMEPYKAVEVRSQRIVSSGPGHTQRRRNDATTAIYLNVGCGDKLWYRHKVLVAGLREQSRDGTLSHILRLHVLGWRLTAVKPLPRRKRQSPLEASGSYNYGDEDDGGDYSGYDDGDDVDEEDDDYSNVDLGPVPDLDHKVQITPYSESASSASDVNFSKEPISPRRIEIHSPIEIVPVSDIPTTTEPELQTVKILGSNELLPSQSEPSTSPSSSSAETVFTSPNTTSTSMAPITPSSTTTTSTSTTTSTTMSTSTTTSTTSAPLTTTAVTTPIPLSTTTPVPEITTDQLTNEDILTTTEHTSTIVGRTTEVYTLFSSPPPINQPPTLNHHMKKLRITAGEAFRYIIPADLFTDPEDGNNLTLTMYEGENVQLTNDSWIQFIPSEREVYGLPLESHVSRWNFIVEAQDSEGLVARGPLDVTVQQHRSGRAFNHQFILEFKLVKEYTKPIDWQIRALEGIVNLFRDTDMHNLTVLNATQNGDMCEFVWTNNTLPKDAACPIDDISRLMKIMESESEAGSPSAGLTKAMSPELKMSSVTWRGAGPCAGGVAWRGTGPATSGAPATRPPDTYPPVMRNQVDHLTATVGHLLVYKVPEDTFFDPEDGDTRNLALSLRYKDRSELPAGHWLQFDARNQEFYGLPAPTDEGPVQYQLVAEDSSKKSAYDSLIVEVVKAPAIRPTVEFQMTVDYPFEQLAYNANNKRKLVEKLAALFDDKNINNIRIRSITDQPPTIIWYNTSLPMDRCPKKEIEALRKMIIVDEREATGAALKEHVDQIFDKEVKVMSIRLIPLGLCADHFKKAPKLQPGNSSPNLQNSKPGTAEGSYTEYLVTFVIPAVVIVCMILVAGIIACVLYRRRRTGKMSVGDEEERQAFRSKGIPVIFQDELEERGDTEPVHKSPVIMREEKPPLLPPTPDYRSGEDAPYRPPPPFAATRTPPRPKATPTYRKPPPYVPP